MHRLLASHANVKAWDRINHYELARWISQCDVAVFPTVEEGFGNTIPQTMACGVPVIATANSCARDVVADGVEGFVVPAMDRDRLREMGQAALTRMRRRTWDDVVAEIIDGLSPARHSMAVAG